MPNDRMFIQGYQDAQHGQNDLFRSFVEGSPGILLAYNLTELFYYSGWLTEHYDVKNNNTERLNKYSAIANGV